MHCPIQESSQNTRLRCRSSQKLQVLLALACFLASALILAGDNATAQPLSSSEELARRVELQVKNHDGAVSVSIVNLNGEGSFHLDADSPRPTASLIKFPVLLAIYDKSAAAKIDLDSVVTLKKSDKVPGSGVLTKHFSAGATLKLRDAAQLMIAHSDNTATNLVLDAVPMKQVNDYLARLGLKETRIFAKVFRRDTSVDPELSREFGLGRATTREITRLLQKLHEGKLAPPKVTLAILNHLYDCESQVLTARLPSGTRVAHKGGAVSKSRCSAGIIHYPGGAFAICVMTNNNKDRSWTRRNQAEQMIGRVARTAYDHFVSRSSRTKPSGLEVLANGSNGRLVEDLQRTLNSRLAPSPNLAVDGDFGPATLATLKRFQRQSKIDETGEVDQATWAALGELVPETKAPEPHIVNNEALTRLPADSLTGAPHVTCKAWALAKLKSRQLIDGFKADKALDMASTTKIMTALLVVEFAKKHPEALDEVITFSARADGTPGSTAGVRKGERVSVKELMYGLMLPSGNDASVAFAEHFGSRLEHANLPDPKKTASYDRFIAGMNERAKQLGMKQTTFRNPHGLTAANHRTSANDLVRLARATMSLPLLRKVVSTRQHGSTLGGPGKYRRNVVWKNTNKLLPTTGYVGLKTGTTNAAGACLVSVEERDGEAIICVVLGATSSDARYTDTRNLFRWGWKSLSQKQATE